MRRAIIFGSSLAGILALAYLWPMVANSSGANGGARGAMCVAGHCCCAGRAEAVTLAADESEGASTLDPKQFVGPVREAYTFAGKNPALLAQLHCYCGCDRTLGHQSLLDCYRGTHASVCEICIQSALMAKQLSKQDSPVEQIREAIRRNFAPDN